MMENALRMCNLQSHGAAKPRNKQQHPEAVSYILVVPPDEFRSSSFDGSTTDIINHHHVFGCELLRSMYEESRAHAAASGVTVNAKMPALAKLYHAACSADEQEAVIRSIGHHHY